MLAYRRRDPVLGILRKIANSGRLIIFAKLLRLTVPRGWGLRPMPRTEVVFYCDEDGSAPVLKWLDGLPLKARLKCLDRIERLRELGHELRRPEVDFLRDGVYELRVSLNHVQYRLLYFFHSEKEPGQTERPEAIGAGSIKKRPVARGHGGGPSARRTVAVAAHGITKEGKVPDQEIERALGRMRKFMANPVPHRFTEG